MDILKIADEVKAERTYFDNELIALTFSIANLEKFVWCVNNELEIKLAEAEALQVKLETMQEVLDKLAQEPVGYFKAEPFGWTDCGEDDEGAMALYEAPQPVASEPVAWMGLSADGAKFLSWRNTSKNKIPLYTTPQPDRVAELEANLEIAKKALELYARSE